MHRYDVLLIQKLNTLLWLFRQSTKCKHSLVNYKKPFTYSDLRRLLLNDVEKTGQQHVIKIMIDIINRPESKYGIQKICLATGMMMH